MPPQLPPEGDDTLYLERDAAHLLGVCSKTLERHRKTGKAPPHIRSSRGVFYRGQAIRRHLLSQECGQ